MSKPSTSRLTLFRASPAQAPRSRGAGAAPRRRPSRVSALQRRDRLEEGLRRIDLMAGWMSACRQELLGPGLVAGAGLCIREEVAAIKALLEAAR